jgi:hypothetical protein
VTFLSKEDEELEAAAAAASQATKPITSPDKNKDAEKSPETAKADDRRPNSDDSKGQDKRGKRKATIDPPKPTRPKRSRR